MSSPSRRPLSTARAVIGHVAAALVAVAGIAVATTPTAATAADAPWTLPTVPPKCTTTQMNSGDVAGCVITLGPGNPEDRGWPKPPFPDAVPGDVLPWVDLARGSTGLVVAKVQEALNTNGATLEADGNFGSLTESAVKAYQTKNGLPSTGIVDQATADSLGVKNTTFTFPPPGWTWLGWGYNGTSALGSWEKQLVTNTTAIGALRPGTLRAFPDALPLFAGFFAEIQAKGYVIKGGTGTYVFRCTSSTRKDCSGLTRAALSNHAYGLATDINTVANPQKTYYGINGASACQTPMLTDMPHWVIQTAEKWGLYWGGYGWSSGCSSPSQWRTSVSRDAMHFEFNGTPAQAQAILRANVGSGACFQVASETGVITDTCLMKGQVPAAGTRIVIETGAPAGATAALVNITTTAAPYNGFVTAEGCGAVTGPRAWSNANSRPGRATASSAIVPIDAQGRFCLYQSAPMHTLVDVQGFFAPAASAPTGTLFTLTAPARVTDSRSRSFCGPDGACVDTGPIPANTEVLHVGAAPVDAVATMANVTVVRPTSAGYLTADSCPSLVPGEQPRSNVNFVAGDTVANLAVVPSVTSELGTLFCTTATASGQQLVDVQGYFGPAAQGGLGLTVQTPDRLVDTRECWTDAVAGEQPCNKVVGAGTVIHLRAPAGASAVTVNLTTVGSTQPGGFVSADSCAAIAAGTPTTSNVNAAVGAAVPNTAVVPVDADGTFCVYVSSPMHVVVDLLGSWSPTGELRFVPVTPVRVHDTRVAS